MKHTPGPYRYKKVLHAIAVSPAYEISGQSASWFAHTSQESSAKFIVKACNSHEELLEALKDACEFIIGAHGPKELFDRMERLIKKAEGDQ